MRIKRLLALFVGIALIMFFTLPSMLFGEPGDNSTSLSRTDGQFEMDPNDFDYSDAPEEAPAGEIMDVYCIDEHIQLTTDTDAYIETNIDVSDELMADGVDAVDAEAVEIMATTATGASNSDNQEAVWDLIGGDSPENSTVGKIIDAVTTISDGFVNDNPGGLELQEYLDDENVNEIDVTLDSDPLVNVNGDYSDFEATAIMENPLVPEVTDQGKDVFWKILLGSYNVSFSQADLVLEDITTMNDSEDDNDGSNAEDTDGDGTTTGDHYGMASIPYYFYWWGGTYPEFEEMSVNIGACVDIDEDGMIDKEKGTDLNEFNANAKVVQTVLDGSLHIVEIDINGNVVTAIPDNVDIDYFNAGKILTTQYRPEDGIRQEYPVDQRFAIESYSEPCDRDSETYSAWGSFEVTKTNSETGGPVAGAVYQLTYISGQTNTPDPIPVYTLTTGADGKASVPGLPWGTYELKEFSSPPGYDLDPTVYTLHIGGTALFDEESEIDGSIVASRDVQNDPRIRESYGSITLNKSGLDATDTAGFTLYDSNGAAVGGEKTITGNGSVEWSNLLMDTYKIVETTTPSGYTSIADITGIVVDSTQLSYSFDRVNTKLPPPPKKTTTTTTTTPVIEVLGIQELPFTGMNPVIPISGISTIFAGGLMVVLSTIRKRFGRK